MARVRSLVRLKRLLDEWRARGETARAMGLTGESVAPPSVAGARALVVDDWDLSAQTIQEALSRDGIVAGRARTGAEAMELSAAIPFDLIVLSLSLIEEDPLKLASSLRAADATHEIPMLLIAEPEEREQHPARLRSRRERLAGAAARRERTARPGAQPDPPQVLPGPAAHRSRHRRSRWR